MIITCPNCKTKYVVPGNAITGDGRKVKCSQCAHIWKQEVPEDQESLPEFSYEEFASLSIPEESGIPMVMKKNQVPFYLKLSTVALMLIMIPLAGIHFRADLQPSFPGIYEYFGYYDTTGLKLANVTPTKMKHKRQQKIMVNGVLLNESESTKKAPMLRITLTNKDNKILEVYQVVIDENLEAGAVKEFSEEFLTYKKDIQFISVDIGDPLSLSMR